MPSPLTVVSTLSGLCVTDAVSVRSLYVPVYVVVFIKVWLVFADNVCDIMFLPRFSVTLESDDLDSTEKFGFFYTIGVGPNYTFSMSHSVAEIHNSASGATIAFFEESDFESLTNALQKVSDKRKADMLIDEKFDKYLKNLDNIVRDLGSDK